MKKIAIITTKWNTTFVDPCVKACEAELLLSGLKSDNIDIITVPGAVEIPLIAKRLAKTEKYSAIIAIAFVYGGGIYRHEFVAQSVVDQIVKLSSETNLPILSSVLTPVSIDMKNDSEVQFYADHMVGKGKEVAQAGLETIQVLENI